MEYYPKVDSSSNVSDIKTFIDTSYSIEGTGKNRVPIKIAWSKAGQSTTNFYSDTVDFWFELQGSSTRRNISKNFTLGVTSNEETTYLFSPNYDASDNKSFLPETSFTLKADVVDSSHSNNVAMGKFINANTQTFHPADQSIKNCLDGFPILIFFRIFEGNNNTSAYQTYYFGIYNFNLGRDSYTNLGYYVASTHNNIISQLNKTKHGDFQLIGINTAENPLALNQAITVAEISDGSAYHDFSQCDDSILFEIDGAEGMFGDIVPGAKTTIATDKERIKRFTQKVAKAGGWIFKNIMNKAFNDDQRWGYTRPVTGTDPDDDTQRFDFNSYNGVPDCTRQWRKSIDGSGKLAYTLITDNPGVTNEDLSPSASSVFDILTEDENIDAANARNQYLLDIQSAVEYYTICMIFGLVDSVQKNLNIKTFTSGKSFVIAFYDMDTCLGIDNNADQVAWFAFSDYWIEGPDKNIINYTDFYPKRTASNASLIDLGYDIPSSYLFAIAKYASLIDGIDCVTPQDLWRKWRGSVIQTSKMFVDEYYKKQMKDVPDALFALNYRFKYLRRAGSGLISDSNNLLGRGVARVESWLDGRFHLLDAYFNNLQSVTKKYCYRDFSKTGAPWVDTAYSEIRPDFAVYTSDSPDNFLAGDIFNEGDSNAQALKLNTSGTFTFTSTKYNPTIIYTGNEIIARQLSMNSDTVYPIRIDVTGSQTVTFGGSQGWTSLTNCGLFVDNSKKFAITSNNIQHIQGDEGTISSFKIKCPSLQVLDLNCLKKSNTQFSGGIEFINDGTYDPNPSLRTVDISGTNIDLNITNESVKEVKLERVKAENISLINDFLLEDVVLTGSEITNLNITPVWNDDLTISGNKITNMNLSGKGGTIKVQSDSTLLNVTFNNFKTVQVVSCTNVESVNIPSSKTVNQDDTLTSLTISNARKITELDLSSHDNLEYLNLNGCALLQVLKLSKRSQNKLTYLNISSTQIKEIIWVDDDGNESGQNWIDLSNADSLTLSTSQFICQNNQRVEYVRLPNLKTDSESVFLKDHVDSAVYVGSFTNCPRLRRIFGNFVVSSPDSFKGCTRFSIHGERVYYGDSIMETVNARMPYKLITGIPNDDATPTSKYFDNPSGKSMDVRFIEDYEGETETLYATNMSFNLMNMDTLFQGTQCTLFDIYYFFSNCTPVSIKNTGISMVGTFVNIGVLPGNLDRYLLHNTENIISFDPFNGTTTFVDPIKYESPDLVGGEFINNGFYSPLYKTCTTLSKSNETTAIRNIGIIDNNFFKGNFTDASGNKIYCALQKLQKLENMIVSNRGSWASHNLIYDVDNLNDPTDGNFSEMFSECLNLMQITDSFKDTLFINYDTLRIPDAVSQISNSFTSAYGSGELNLCENGRLNSSSNYIFSANNNLSSLVGSFVVTGSYNGVRVSYTLHNDTLKDLTKLQIYGSGTNAQCGAILSGNGINKQVFNPFPYNIFQPCKDTIKTLVGFFLGAASEEAYVDFPGTLYKNLKELVNTTCGGYGSSMVLRLTSNGFNDCTNLQNVSGFFKNIRMTGHIPAHLFDNKKQTITSMYQLFYHVKTMSPYNNPTPVDEAEYDGIHNLVTEDKANIALGSSYLPAPYRSSEINSAGNTVYKNVMYNMDNSNALITLNYAFAPDLFWYCGPKCNISQAFSGCGQRNGLDGVPIFEVQPDSLIEQNGGMRGRIPPSVFRYGSNIQNAEDLFKNCSLITGYQREIDGVIKAFVLPEGLFTNMPSGCSIKNMFEGFVFPKNLSLNGAFKNFSNGIDMQYLFYHCYFDSVVDEDGNVIERCEIGNFGVNSSGLQLNYMFAFNDSPGKYTPTIYDITSQYIKFSNFLYYDHNETYANTRNVFINYDDTLEFDRDILLHIPADSSTMTRGNYKSKDGLVYSSIAKLQTSTV